jgi:hypothetical protein
MGTFVHEEFKSHHRVPAGRLLYVYTAATAGSLATLTDVDGVSIANPVVLDPTANANVAHGENSGVAVFKCASAELLWGITDYDIANGVSDRRPLYCALESDVDLGALTITAAMLNALDDVPTTYIVVSKDGNDTTGKGSFAFPYLTLTKAFTVWNATRHTIYALAGEYEEAATLTWPNIKGLSLVTLGEVSVSNADAAAQVLLIAPTYTASSFGATIKGPLNLAGTGAQIGLKVANAAMTKKLNVYIDGLSAEIGTSGDSIDIAGTVAGQAIRVYAKNLELEGLLHFTANDAGSRLRVDDSALMGGIDCDGAVAAESALRNCKVLYGGKSIASEWNENNVGCIYATDADPAVYSEFADVYAG